MREREHSEHFEREGGLQQAARAQFIRAGCAKRPGGALLEAKGVRGSCDLVGSGVTRSSALLACLLLACGIVAIGAAFPRAPGVRLLSCLCTKRAVRDVQNSLGQFVRSINFGARPKVPSERTPRPPERKKRMGPLRHLVLLALTSAAPVKKPELTTTASHQVVVRFNAASLPALEAIRAFSETEAVLFDYWSPLALDAPFDVRMEASQATALIRSLAGLDATASILIPDLHLLLATEKSGRANPLARSEN